MRRVVLAIGLAAAIVAACSAFREAPDNADPHASTTDAGIADANGADPLACISTVSSCDGSVEHVAFNGDPSADAVVTTTFTAPDAGCGGAIHVHCNTAPKRPDDVIRGFFKLSLADPLPRRTRFHHVLRGIMPLDRGAANASDPFMALGCGFTADDGKERVVARFEVTASAFAVDGKRSGDLADADPPGLTFSSPSPGPSPLPVDLEIEIVTPDKGNGSVRITGSIAGGALKSVVVPFVGPLKNADFRCGLLDLRSYNATPCDVDISDITRDTCAE